MKLFIEIKQGDVSTVHIDTKEPVTVTIINRDDETRVHGEFAKKGHDALMKKAVKYKKVYPSK